MTNYKKSYKKKIVKLQVDLYPTDKDIIDHLNKNKPIATYLKALIRREILKENNI